MATREVPHEQWDAFLLSFSRECQGQPAHVELHWKGQGTVMEAENRRLQQVWSEHSGDHEQISIVLGEASESEHVTYIVSEPRRVRFRDTETGVHEVLEVEADEGTTVLQFLRPKQSEASGNAGGKVRS